MKHGKGGHFDLIYLFDDRSGKAKIEYAPSLNYVSTFSVRPQDISKDLKHEKRLRRQENLMEKP